MTHNAGGVSFSGVPLGPIRFLRNFGRLAKRLRASAFDATGTAIKRLLRTLEQSVAILVYRCQGSLPWSLGYGAYRNIYIAKLIKDDEFMRVFQEGCELPDNFGMRLDERVVEYPWVISKVKQHKGGSRFLDAGSTLNNEMMIRHNALQRHNWTLLTLAPEMECYWSERVSYVFDDLRSMPFRDGLFDGVFCISVIEHVGMDNAFYTADSTYRENKPLDYLDAIKEIRRVLRPGGSLYLTVPFGHYENHGWLQQFDSAMLTTLISHFDPETANKTFFRYTAQGWKLATEEQCEGASFFNMDGHKFSSSGKINKYDMDFAAAARGVACLQLQKQSKVQ